MKYAKSYETQPLNPASEVHSLTSSKQQKQAEVRYGNERLSLQSCREIALDIVFPPTKSRATTMECLLRPTDRDDNRLPALVKIPYVAGQRWDGGPFLTYPLRKGLPEMYFGAGGTTEHPWEIRPDAHGTPTEDLQVFFQEWLFFGLIIEALDGNTETTSSSALPPTEQATAETAQELKDKLSDEPPQYKRKHSIISRVYRDFVYQAETESYITTETFLAELHDSWTISLLSFYPTRNRLAVRCKRMRLCLRQAHYFYTHLPADFCPNIKFAIGAVAEIIGHAMQPVCHYLNLNEICPNEWGNGYYQSPEVQLRMSSGEWCPNELIRTVNKFKYLHTLHYLSFLDKKKAPGSHADCNPLKCKAGKKASTDGSRNHWKVGCSCREVKVNHQDVMRALKVSDAIPLLVFKDSIQGVNPTQNGPAASQGEVDLNIEVVRSTKSTPYVAISHVSLPFHPTAKPLTIADLVRWSRQREGQLAQCL
jgi:hypothetical protein